MIKPTPDGKRYELFSPTVIPNAGSFLWNPKMMINITCRGYAVAQFMQPEPTKYSHGPTLEEKTFMQPEHPYYQHHPGRFFFIKDEESGKFFSSPFEPVREKLTKFLFSAGQSDIRWEIENDDLRFESCLSLDALEPIEIWDTAIQNNSAKRRLLSLYTYFPVGYMSWMNQGASFDSELNAIVCSSVTPYQKLEDYFKNKHLKDITYLIAELSP